MSTAISVIVPAPWNPLDLIVPAALAALIVTLHLIGRHRDRRAVRVRWVPRRTDPEADALIDHSQDNESRQQ